VKRQLLLVEDLVKSVNRKKYQEIYIEGSLKMLRIILLVGNISIFILPVIGLNFSINDPEIPPLIY